MTTKNKVSRLTTDERIKKLVEIPDNDIDYSDIPDMSNSTGWQRLYPEAGSDTNITDKMMFDALSRAFEAPELEKVPVTIKLDPRIVEFFKQHSKKYQVKINDVLMEFVNTYKKSHTH
jgi:uncharacterized protein (DUF4415 family)